MASSNSEKFDVIVVGGGPAGATLASLVAKQGHSTLVLEKTVFPRYQVGESLLPSTVHGICRLTGAAEHLEKAGFIRKLGGTLKWGSGSEPWTFSFSISPRMAGPTSFAYQVERMKFDQILLDNARNASAEVREGCATADVIADNDRVRGVRYRTAEGKEHLVLGRYVVDASGSNSKIYHGTGGVRNYSEFFRSLAVFGYFDGGRRLPEPNSGNILSVAFDGGWFWYIPLTDTLTSVGAVVSPEVIGQRQGNPKQLLGQLIKECPIIAEYLSGAQRITDGEYGKVRVRKDYSYHNTKVWRPGMVLVGDSACFVDPVFSSGVHLATYSALLAARSINSAMAGIVDEKEAFREFESRYLREYGAFYEFLAAFYDMHVDKNSYFWQAKKVTESKRSELEAFVDLVGGIASGEPSLRDADAAAQRLRSRSGEFASAVETLSGGQDDSMVPLFKTSVVRQAMQESTEIQSRALLGEEADDPLPLVANGLVPSADGMFWIAPG